MNTFLTKVSAWYTVVGLVQCIRYLAYLGVTTDHTIELYSSKGKTYTVKARKRRSVSRETKLRRIALARWCAFVTICLIWVVGFKSCDTVTPRSRQNERVTTYDHQCESLSVLWLAICHILAHSVSKSRVFRSLIASQSLTISSLTSSANNLIVTPARSSISANSLM